MPLSKPTVVILLSDKRSGSTIFQKEFCRHRDVRTVDYSSHTYLETHHWLKGAVMLQRPPRLYSAGQVYAGYGGARNARTYMIDTLRGNLPEFDTDRDDRALIFDGWEALCTEFSKPVFFEKSPQILSNWAALSLLLEWKAQTAFDVRLVGLIRNPLAVQHSSEKLFGSPPDVRQFGWQQTYCNLLTLKSMLPEDQLRIWRHEDILAEPKAQFAEICRFVGLDPDPEMGATVTSRTQDRWRADPDYRLRLDPVVRQIAAAFGYGDDDLHNPNAGDAPHYSRGQGRPKRPLTRLKDNLRNRVLRPLKLRLRHKTNR